MSGGVSINGLGVRFAGAGRPVIALEDVSLDVRPGEKVGIIGESGSGKSTLINALSGPPNGSGADLSGDVRFGDLSVTTITGAALRDFRRESLAYIGQDPHGSLDPTTRVATQLRQALGLSRGPELNAAVDFHLRRVGFPDPQSVARRYPHQLSGGMAQRVVIAFALARRPQLVIADEPTSALDSTLRTSILDLIVNLVDDSGASLVMVSHDLAAIRRYCDTTVVMYSGRIVEWAPTATLFERPRHPYTAALLGAALGLEGAGERLDGIPGTQRTRHDSVGCAFADRCQYRVAVCKSVVPLARMIDLTRVECHRADELDLEGR